MDGRTDRQADSYIPPQTEFWGGIIRDLLWSRLTPTGISLFLHEQFVHLHTGNTQRKVSNIASDEDIVENNYTFVLLWNLNVISHLIFPQCSF